MALGTSYQVTVTMSEFQAPPLINKLVGGNSIIDTRTHLSVKASRSHTSVECFAIIRASLREGYKRGEEEQKGVRTILERDTQEKGENIVLEI